MALQAIKNFRYRELGAVLKASTPKVAQTTPKIPNPFLPFLNPDSGRWAPAKYSLRRQAELIKKARESNTLHLLPLGPKHGLAELRKLSQHVLAGSTEQGNGSEKTEGEAKRDWWTRELVWEGEVKEKNTAGADIGNRLYAGKKRMFKGHKWERMKDEREKQLKMLMKSMPQRIQQFKGVSTITCLGVRRNGFNLSMHRRIGGGNRVHSVDHLLRRNLRNCLSSSRIHFNTPFAASEDLHSSHTTTLDPSAFPEQGFHGSALYSAYVRFRSYIDCYLFIMFLVFGKFEIGPKVVLGSGRVMSGWCDYIIVFCGWRGRQPLAVVRQLNTFRPGCQLTFFTFLYHRYYFY